MTLPTAADTITAFRAERFGVTLRALRAIQIELGTDPAIVPSADAAAYLLDQILHIARIVKDQKHATNTVANDSGPTTA